jgi:hypothetical protein
MYFILTFSDFDLSYIPDSVVTDSEDDYERTPKRVKLYDHADRTIARVIAEQDEKKAAVFHFIAEENLKELAEMDRPSSCDRPSCKSPCKAILEMTSCATNITWVSV